MKSSLRAAATGSAAAFVLSVATGGPAFAQTFHNRDGAIHFMYTPEYAQKIGRVPHRETGEMEYFGGSVFPHVNVVSVMWGSNVNSQTVQGMPGFLKALPNSTFQDQIGQYSTKGVKTVNGHKSSDQTIRRGTFYGQVVITPHNTSTTLSNKAVWKELQYQIGKGNLPAQTPNTLYMIYFPANVTITAFGLQSCSAFGAYHFDSSKHRSATNIYYGVMPDCGYSFNSHTIISAHEFAEATTDNIPTPGSNPAYPQAWNTSDGYEIGDLCEGTQGELTTKTTTYFVQQVYLNSTAACSTGNYHSP
ncbi:MAG TPA: hypothetical protein VKR31_17790 [Rhizomicrobium sp.]|nr:hypothetical protein [Rhizomicrobium sp.]